MNTINFLKESWAIIRRKKSLVFFGLLAAIGSRNVDLGGFQRNMEHPFSANAMPTEMLDQVTQFWSQNSPWLTIFAFSGLLLAVLFWMLRLTAQASMISIVEKVKHSEETDFRRAFSIGLSKLKRLLGVSVMMYGPFVLLGLLILGAVLVQIWNVINVAALGVSPAEMEIVLKGIKPFLITFIFLVLFGLPLLLIVSLIYPFVQRGVVLNNLRIFVAIRQSTQIIKENLRDFLSVIALLLGISIFFSVIVFLLLIPFSSGSLPPGLASWLIQNDAAKMENLPLLIAQGAGVWLIASTVNSLAVALRSTLLTMFYLESTAEHNP